LVPALPQLLSKHPRLHVELISDSRNLSLTRREADMALRFARPEGRARHLTKRLGDVGYAVYGPRQRGANKLPWISYEEGFSSLPQARWIAQTCNKENLVPVLVSDSETILHSVRAGIGKSLLPRFVADSDPQLRRLSGESDILKREIWLLSHRDLHRNARVIAVVDWLEQLVRQRLP
jgi:DNA-binding transcriptional LysR family regulator